MSALDDVRSELHASIANLATAHALGANRVHIVTPDRVDAPCLFIGGTSVDRENVGNPGVTLIIATLPVFCVADGRPSAQTLTLDNMIALVWDAALAIGSTPVDARPTSLDVGGPHLRGAVVQVESTMRAVTLCAPILEASHV
jgi:hypothetical protein